MKAKELLGKVQVKVLKRELKLSEDRRHHYAAAELELSYDGSPFTFRAPYSAGLGTLEPEQFNAKELFFVPGIGRCNIAQLLELIEKDRYRLKMDTEEALRSFVEKSWTPDKANVIYALVSDAEAYAYSGGNFGAFAREYAFTDCGEALEAFKACEATFKWLVFNVGLTPENLSEIRDELEPA